MSFATLLAGLKLSPRDAEVIFDRSEPVGQPSDLTLPSRRWFRRKKDVRAMSAEQTRGARRHATGASTTS